MKQQIGLNFKNKILSIMHAEKLTMSNFSREVDIEYCRIYHYVNYAKANPSIDNVVKVINRFPEYTSYILEIDLKGLKKQIILKD